MKNKLSVPVIDLFAGPGGLGEGFSSYEVTSNYQPFKITSSVEMDPYAHKTLVLRSFYREFRKEKVPEEYYEYLRGKISREILFEKYPKQARAANLIAMQVTLGTPDGNKKISQRLKTIFAKSNSKPWVLIGGPPCQAYSIIGRSRQQAKGKGRKKHQKDHRNFLYKEYLKILAEFQPAVFIMENVAGILSAEIAGEHIFNKILSDLKKPSTVFNHTKSIGNKDNLEYKIYSLAVPESKSKKLDPRDFIIPCEDYGIPQTRHRVILLGIRNDINIKSNILIKNVKKISVNDVISDLPKLRSDITKTKITSQEWHKFIQSIPQQSWFRKGNRLKIQNKNKQIIDLKKEILHFLKKVPDYLTTGSEYLKTKSIPLYRKDWFIDKRLKGVINHTSRGHMDKDLYRYFYAATYAQKIGKSPLLSEYPRQLLPNHQNVLHHNGYIKFDDRFRVQLKDKPARTITCHLSKDGHYNIHYDPTQCRSLTVREAARIQTFPDNYFFEGPRTQKFKQVGNAVPPLIAYQIAGIVFDVIKSINK